jgi:hypothetical protein
MCNDVIKAIFTAPEQSAAERVKHYRASRSIVLKVGRHCLNTGKHSLDHRWCSLVFAGTSF